MTPLQTSPPARRVLIVEDRQEQIDLFAAILGLRFVVATAMSAEIGVSLLRDDLLAVVSDFGLGGRDGLWLLEQARATTPAARRVLVTGHPAEEFVEPLRSGLVQVLLTKPFKITDLLTAIGELEFREPHLPS